MNREGHILDGPAKLDVQRATATTINAKSVTELSAATMAEPELADDMFGHFAQCAYELNPAASDYRRKTLLVAFYQQDHSKF